MPFSIPLPRVQGYRKMRKEHSSTHLQDEEKGVRIKQHSGHVRGACTIGTAAPKAVLLN